MDYANSLKALRAKMIARTTGRDIPQSSGLESFIPARAGSQPPQEATEDLLTRSANWLSEIKDAAALFANTYQIADSGTEAKSSTGGFAKGLAEGIRKNKEEKRKAEEAEERREAFITRRSEDSPSTYAPERPKEREVRVNGEPVPTDAEMPAVLEAIAAVESRGSGDYAAIGPVVKRGMYKGQRAYGRYQVMEGNIGPWTEAAIGRRLTVDEFMASPEVQDAVAAYQLQKSKDKFGTWEDAASVWFSGQPVRRAGNRSDGYTTVPEYIAKFRRNFVRSQ